MNSNADPFRKSLRVGLIRLYSLDPPSQFNFRAILVKRSKRFRNRADYTAKFGQRIPWFKLKVKKGTCTGQCCPH